MTTTTDNFDRAELAKFDSLASRWWDTEGDFKPLHQINPLRLDWIRQQVNLAGCRVVDIGCGGGILTESMAAASAEVTGIDMAEGPLSVARLHQLESGADVDYRKSTAEDLAAAEAGKYDVVTCLEMLEHVPDPSQVVRSCAELVRPGGHVFFSTINRNPKSFLFAIVGAEYVLKLLPTGTHEYAKFIRPSELESWARNAGLKLLASIGMHYDPLGKEYSLGANLDVNYLMSFRRPAS
ncbi:MAG: bifunctional 2-polyprenyl-6-hydroxyphenol methylase/3-demethylubiquinol 3-O-methyltransferase UbiG [Gammaproteobacteria bacterium]|nr:bifunctional 2-polyprenyl-6-hydroxyphenol methylase/3-demethylubiquinol 3-O-methyltransferase UbiG [Gammaproteobacteria bacterium]NNC57453.1 bifunctional 2-polyprenyl-6-hydroxyphenol methylase/3-demethylubiquinol 3-O-methyltransferase UbiG [Woeseiaceae bacterium]NNL49194.1 bifunctional 2-polyprenyl-6-hydroxyphenol methylase/3-demethylubiquinol 3-O-methyltransferase UbiG [Woeseiaceae bacterium]